MMKMFPVIDPVATGENITRLRKARGLTVRDLQDWFGFEEPQAIYKWQKGKSLPTVDNLYALGVLLDVPLEEILVTCRPKLNMVSNGQQDLSCCPPLLPGSFEYGRISIPCHHFLLSPAA
jgi:transcriptional regulator with XRE-family HTH domain